MNYRNQLLDRVYERLYILMYTHYFNDVAPPALCELIKTYRDDFHPYLDKSSLRIAHTIYEISYE